MEDRNNIACTAEKLDAWVVSSYDNVLQSRTKPDDSGQSIDLVVARNEFEAAQILTRSKDKYTINHIQFSDMTNGNYSISSENFRYHFVEYTFISENTLKIPECNMVAKAPGYFPEALSNDATINVPANTTQPIWIKTYIPKYIPAGMYSGTIMVNTTIESFTVPISLEVNDVTIPDANDAEFEVEFWTRIEGNFRKMDGENLLELHYGYNRYSDEWWQVVDNMANLLKENRSNVLLINTLDLLKDGGTTIAVDGTVDFNWSKFDEYIKFMIDKGVVKKLAGTVIANKKPDHDHYAMLVLRTNDNTGEVEKAAIDFEDSYAHQFVNQYIPALSSHLKEKGWSDIWYQHLADEPVHAQEPHQWGEVKDLVRKHAPEMVIGDAYVDNEKTQIFTNYGADRYIPLISVYEKDVDGFKELQEQGKTVWMYTTGGDCYLNRLTDTHVWQMISLGWLMYKRGVVGFLHWGWNYWINKVDAHVVYTNPAELAIDKWPVKGSNYCVHPDPVHNTVKSTIRYEAVRDACEDYELLKILEKRDKSLAASIVDSIVTNGTTFSNDIDLMIEKRALLIREAAKGASS